MVSDNTAPNSNTTRTVDRQSDVLRTNQPADVTRLVVQTTAVATHTHTNSRKSDRKRLVSGMIDFVQRQFHALHLSPRIALGPFRHALVELFFATQGLIGLHRRHHFAHLANGHVVFSVR